MEGLRRGREWNWLIGISSPDNEIRWFESQDSHRNLLIVFIKAWEFNHTCMINSWLRRFDIYHDLPAENIDCRNWLFSFDGAVCLRGSVPRRSICNQ